MPAVLAGEAAVRIIPSMRGFHTRLEREIKKQPHHIDVLVNADLSRASKEMQAWRARQESNSVTVPIRTDFAAFRRDLTQVEHIFKKNALSRALRLNVKVLGLDALPALAYAAGGAASGLDQLGKSAFALPGLMAGAGASIGALAVGLRGVKDAFDASADSAEQAAERSKNLRDADQELVRSKRDLISAVRDQRRELEDINAEMRRSSLNEADAILSVQEDAQRLRDGGFKSITEFQRAQLNYLKSVDNLQSVRTRNLRLQEDANKANEAGILGSDRVADALDRVTDATERMNDAASKTDFEKALDKLSPKAQSFVGAAKSMEGAWTQLQHSVQDNLFDGLDRSLTDLGQRALPGLEIGLSRVASGINANFRSVAESLGNETNGSFLERIFGNTDGGLTNLSRAMNPLIEGFLRFSAVSSDALPRLGDAADRVFTRFNEWTKRIAADGSLARWIDQGLDALSNLGNSFINIGSAISSVAQAWNLVQGGGGFTAWLERSTKSLADFLKSAGGQQGLMTYFGYAKDLMATLRDSFSNIMPLVKDMTALAREWSTWMLKVVGAFASSASWIEKNTGLLKPMLFAYLSIRTLAPLWEAATTGARNYTRVMEALGSWERTSGTFSRFNDGLSRARDGFAAVVRSAPNATSELKHNAIALAGVNEKTRALFQPNQNLVTQMDRIKESVNNASASVGWNNGRGRNLLGALGGLATFIGPALGAGVLGVVLAAAIGGIYKLGDAHRAAADDAERQQRALDGLAGSLDRVSGAVNAETLMQVARNNQAWDQPGLGKRNLNEDIVRAGLGSPQDLLRAQMPTNQDARNDLVARGDAALKAKLQGSDEWKRYGPVWEKRGVDIDTWVRAANGDQEALGKVRAAEADMMRGRPSYTRNANAAMGNDVAPDLLNTINAIGAQDIVSVTGGVRGVSDRLTREGSQIQEATRAAYGALSLTPEGAALFGPAGATNQKVFPDGRGGAVIEVDRPISVDPELGSVTPLNPGQWQVVLTDAGVKKFVGGFASGGLIGGVGSGTSDSNLMLASRGEFVTRKKAVDHYGPGFFERLNALQLPKFEEGGPIEPGGQPLRVDQNVLSPFEGYRAFQRDYADPMFGAPAGGGWIGKAQPHHEVHQPTIPKIDGSHIKVGLKSLFGIDGHGWAASSSALFGGGGNFAAGGLIPAFNDGGLVPDWEKTAREALGRAGYQASPAANPAPPAPKVFGPPLPAPKVSVLTQPQLPAGPAVLTQPKLGPRPAPAAAPGVPNLTGASPGPHGAGANPGPGNLGNRSDVIVNRNLAALSNATGLPGSQLRGALPPGMLTNPSTALAANRLAMSGRLPARVANPEDGLQVNTIGVKRVIENMFPLISSIGGWREDAVEDHPSGQAIDVMIPNWDTPEGKAYGDRIVEFIRQNGAALGIDSFIWQDTWQDLNGNTSFLNRAGSQGATQGHMDHIHIKTTGGGFPTGAESYGIPESILAASGLQLGPNGLPTGGSSDGVGGILAGFFGGRGGGRGGNPYSPENVTQFLGSQAQNVGSQLLQIGTQFLAGITGIDFSSVIGYGQQIGNGILNLNSDSSSGGGGASDLNSLVDQEMQQFMGGGGALSMTSGLDGLLGAASAGGAGANYNPGGGAEQWRPLVRQVVTSLAGQYGITNVQAWEDALVKQIATESSGNPNSVNPNDSNGQGGTQRVAGLLNFLDTTFAAHNVLGTDYMDPMGQIAAAVDYVYKKYGVNENGSPKQIGMGVGFARGGLLKGLGGPRSDSNLIRVSRGEFLHNAAAVRHYGPDFFTRLNAMQIPRESLPGFADGMWWNPLQPAPSTPGPLPGPPPDPSVGGQPAGPPQPLAPPAVAGESAPSTGGAPGPGATAPAADPGALPEVADALSGIGGAISAGGSAQPGATPAEQADPRATLGAAPVSQEHTNPALSAGIQGAFSTIGSLASTAIQAGAAAGSMGASAAGGGMGAGQAGQIAQAGAEIAGQVATGAVNILSSLMVGTLTGGSTAQASGVPLLPERPPVQSGVPPMQRIHNGDINLTNLDEYKRMEERMAAQAAMPFIGKY